MRQCPLYERWSGNTSALPALQDIVIGTDLYRLVFQTVHVIINGLSVSHINVFQQRVRRVSKLVPFERMTTEVMAYFGSRVFHGPASEKLKLFHVHTIEIEITRRDREEKLSLVKFSGQKLYHDIFTFTLGA